MSSLQLPCTMTDADKIETSGKLSKAIDELRAKEDEKRDANRGFNDEIKARKLSVSSLNALLKGGVIRRKVETEYRVPPEGGAKVLYRLDTDPPERVNPVAIADDERQLQLEKDPPKKKSKAKAEKEAAVDEQRDASTPEEAEELRAARLAQESRGRAAAALEGILAKAKVTKSKAGVFTARVRHNAPVWPDDVEKHGETEEAARAALTEALVDHMLAWEASEARAREAAREAHAERLASGATVEEHTSVTPGAPPTFFVAKADGGTWTMEGEGDTEVAARADLRTKLVEKYKADAAEVDKLAAEQAADEAKTNGAPRRGLRVPGKGPKPTKRGTLGGDKPKGKKAKSGRRRHDDGDDDGSNGVDTTPPAGSDGKALDF